ncbi:hypothetical protein Psi02_42670 [Planotetraspora silvatica]|uniref:Uncharacterized protein n=1 Tax=Planotetraspora silvatica TaxID=234614 RepID=A0A8J3UMC1_9ACTN|nr:hypothetical protein [Planotetraspora silvatica]GII47843.1 hypothetical protein Psi02_42670 [Planotetraspora silvatica]
MKGNKRFFSTEEAIYRLIPHACGLSYTATTADPDGDHDRRRASLATAVRHAFTPGRAAGDNPRHDARCSKRAPKTLGNTRYAMIAPVHERPAMRRLGRHLVDFMVESVVQFVAWAILAVIGAGVVVVVAALSHRPRLTRALVTGDNASITPLAIIGLVALIGTLAAVTWLVRRIRRIRKKTPPPDAQNAGEGRGESTVPHRKGPGRHRSGYFGDT